MPKIDKAGAVMLWMLLLILLCATVVALWIYYRQEREWMRELTYLTRHETAGIEGADEPFQSLKQPKNLRGVDPNLKNTRSSHKAAEEAKEVYDKTVEKLRALSPKHSRKFDAVSRKKSDTELDKEVSELPIFAAAQTEAQHDKQAAIRSLKPEPFADGLLQTEQNETESLSAADSVEAEKQDIPLFTASVVRPEELQPKHQSRPSKHSAQPVYFNDEDDEYRPAKPVDSTLEVITIEEATRALTEATLMDRAKAEELPVAHAVRGDKPAADLEVVELSNWHFRPALETVEPPKPVRDLKTIELTDPSVRRTRERVLSEVQKISSETPRSIVPQPVSSVPETIGEEDIRTNLLRQRMARNRQAAAQAPIKDYSPNVIPEREVFANLAKTDAPSVRRFRRVDTTQRESVIPESVRVERHAIKLQPPRTPVQTPRIAPYAPPVAAATVVEPPVLEDTAPFSVEMSEPVFAREEYDAPKVSISEPVFFNERPSEYLESPVGDELRFAEYRYADVEDEAVLADFESADRFDADDIQESDAEHEEAYASTAVVEERAGNTQLPGLDLLLPPQFDPSAMQTEETLLENSITIEEKLSEFKVKVKVVDAYAGPVITRYEIEPDVGVRGNAVLNLEKDLARSLGVASIRVVETIPGKTCMGLELPNPKRQMIRLSEIFNAPAFQNSKSKLTLALGQDITGEPVVTDLAKAPHLLVAGTTGSGKSVGVNAMILSMLYKAMPEDVRMIMIDPKMLELSIYEGIPHLLAPVVTDMKLAANALNWCVNEMEKRYRLMSHMGVRNLAGFNQKVAEAAAQGKTLANPFSLTPDDPEPLQKLPFIVVVVDEFADLMMTAGKKIEELIARLAQKARAAGIHLILATQRPSVDVITGLIKANIPTRIAFQVSSKVDSRTILDQMGAENLLGQGDMLFLPPGTGYPKRVHGAFASDDEVHHVVEYLKQFGEPDYVDDILTAGVGSDDIFSNANGMRNNEGEQDPMYDDAVSCVLKSGKASISSIQRHLRIGYNRAARLMDQMEEDGIVSAAESNGNRTILVPNGKHLE
ncbi:DNA translocase FtsK [Neisseria weaveri]|uniref:DNA translocase FtsK n=2 Tax=Neisseria weaveri TaxID=28091 RepID=UPI00022323E6|nr:DNA translocase FtsK [Neisseria weaveri ATCC 51223]